MDNKTESKNGQRNRNNSGERKTKWFIWPLKITIITFALSSLFSFGTELVTSRTGLIFALIVLILLIALSIIFDAIGVAVTACDVAPLTSMAARKVKGSKHAIKLVKNADKVASIFADVIGDICGIISGACGAAIALMLFMSLSGSQLAISIIVSAVIASFTVGGKAAMKKIAIDHSTKIVLIVGRLLSFIKPEGKK